MLVLCHAWIDWWDGLLARPVPLDGLEARPVPLDGLEARPVLLGGLEARPTRPIKARVTLH